MKKLVALILMGALAVAACGSSSSSGGPQAAGTNSAGKPCGAGTSNGASSITFCGSAKATVKMGSRSFVVSDGKCTYDKSVGFHMDLGTSLDTAVASSSTGSPSYFGVLSYPGGATIARGVIGGLDFLLNDGDPGTTVTVSADHKSGSASGKLSDGSTLTASWTC